MLRTPVHSAKLISLVLLLALLAAGAWHGRYCIGGSVIAVLDLLSQQHALAQRVPPVSERLVAHAGGAVNGVRYTNSREALDQHYAAGYRVFELDFHWTSDGHLVLVHDWPQASASFAVLPHTFTCQEFVHAARRDGLHQMTFEDLRQWLRAHRDAYIVTDTKASNPRLLAWLLVNGGDVLPQLIVQIYRMAELNAARRLRPRAVWLTVYRYGYPAWALPRLSGVDAIVVPAESYQRYSRAVASLKVPVYVHAIAAQSVNDAFCRMPGIFGIYVD